MERKNYTVEELMLNDSFLNYCLDNQSPDKEFWEKEIELHSDRKAIFAEARYFISLLHGKLDDNEISRQVDKVKEMIGGQGAKYSSPETFQGSDAPQPGNTILSNPRTRILYENQQPPRHLRNLYVLYGTVASVLVFLGLYLFKPASSKAIPPQPAPTSISYNSGTGERRIISLPDGSVAVLNSNSRITFTSDYNLTARTILLSGEAFFRVAKDPAKPFTVHSGSFVVTAVGTSFYVYARDKGKDYKVELLEGKVRLASGENKTTSPDVPPTILLPGEEGFWQSSKKSFTKTFFDSMVLKKWISGKLSFKNMPVEKVLELLQQWYGVNITVNHTRWGKLTLTGDYDNKPLDHVLKIICFSLSAGYSYSGNQVIIE